MLLSKNFMENKESIYKLIRDLRIIFAQKSIFLFGAGISSFYIPPSYDLIPKLKEWLKNYVVEPFISSCEDKISLTTDESVRFKIHRYTLSKRSDGKILINDSEKDIYDDILLKKPWILSVH